MVSVLGAELGLEEEEEEVEEDEVITATLIHNCHADSERQR